MTEKMNNICIFAGKLKIPLKGDVVEQTFIEEPKPIKNSNTCEDCNRHSKVKEYKGKYLCDGCRYVIEKKDSLSKINFEGVL